MIVCLCEAMSERRLRQAVRDGACSRYELSQTTGAGRSCGSCRCNLKRIVSTELSRMDAESDVDALPMVAK